MGRGSPSKRNMDDDVLRRPVPRQAERDARAVGAFEETGVARLSARRGVEARLVQFYAAVLVHGGNRAFGGREVEVVAKKGIHRHMGVTLGFRRGREYRNAASSRPEWAGL